MLVQNTARPEKEREVTSGCDSRLSRKVVMTAPVQITRRESISILLVTSSGCLSWTSDRYAPTWEERSVFLVCAGKRHKQSTCITTPREREGTVYVVPRAWVHGLPSRALTESRSVFRLLLYFEIWGILWRSLPISGLEVDLITERQHLLISGSLRQSWRFFTWSG